MAQQSTPRLTRVERGIYRQPNGKYAVCARHAGRLCFRTAGYDLAAARRQRAKLITALRAGRVPASPRFDTVAGWWLERFAAKVAAGASPRAPSRPIAISWIRTCCRRWPRGESPRSLWRTWRGAVGGAAR